MSKDKKANVLLNFIWLDKRRRAKNFCFLMTVFIVLTSVAVGYINNKLELMITGDDITVTQNNTPLNEGEKPDVENIYVEDEEAEREEAEINEAVSKAGSINEFLYTWANNDIQPYSHPDVINVLLIGLDSKTGLTNGGRSDTLILLSLNRQTKQINMVSFFRDTWCNIAGTEKYGKINSSYSRGGADCLISTIENNFKIDINYYVTVDFSTFVDIIDELGGLTVDVQKYEADYINSTTRLNVPYGNSVVLNGEEALVFARIRKCDSDSDVSRTRRQRMVIKSLINEAKSASIGELNSLLDILLPYVRTNLTKNDIVAYAVQAIAGGWLNYEIVETTISDGEVFKTGYVGKSSVVFIELPLAAQRIQLALYGTTNINLDEQQNSLFSLVKNFN